MANSRQLKFRAWDKQLKRMVPVEVLYFKGCIVSCDGASTRAGCWPMELMQYTGLKDKNGKEIYEGDIVNLVCPVYSRLEPVWVVTWRDAGFVLKHKLEFAYSSLNAVPHNGEVIGNIYENPELLEVK